MQVKPAYKLEALKETKEGAEKREAEREQATPEKRALLNDTLICNDPILAGMDTGIMDFK